MTNKLPTNPRQLWCGLDETGDIKAMHFHRRGIESLNNSPFTPLKLLPVLYEPAVPRCKTCNHFADHKYHALCERTGIGYEFAVPTDGSGYCSNHPDAKP